MRYRRAPGILEADFQRAKVVFNTETRLPFILNGTASEIWELCEKPKDAKALAGYLHTRYGVGVRKAKKDIENLINEFKERGLLKIV
jgi:hypothetical protein